MLSFPDIASACKLSRQHFLDHSWQGKNSVTRIEQLELELVDRIRQNGLRDILKRLTKVGMSIRLTPYVMDLTDWDEVETDPISRHFLPMLSELEDDHPCLTMASLEERATSPIPNIVHRYPDKVLFLATTMCPVYCQDCARSYAVGQDTAKIKKGSRGYRIQLERSAAVQSRNSHGRGRGSLGRRHLQAQSATYHDPGQRASRYRARQADSSYREMIAVHAMKFLNPNLMHFYFDFYARSVKPSRQSAALRAVAVLSRLPQPRDRSRSLLAEAVGWDARPHPSATDARLTSAGRRSS